MSARVLSILVVLLMSAPVARAQEEIPTADLIIPVVGNVIGYHGVEWHTDVILRNDLPQQADVILMLPTLPGDPPPFYMTSMAPGETLAFPDIVRTTFGLPYILSPLLVQTIGQRSVTVSCVVYGVKDGKTTEPQVIAPVAPSLRRSQSLSSLAFDERRRTNIGVANLGDQPAQFTLAVQRIAGRNLATSSFIMPPRSMMQAPIQMFFPLLTQANQLSLIVDLPSPLTYVYASVVENESNRAVFAAPRPGRF